MNNETLNDDILFDRLVDGELSAAERRALLESLDARPQGWRRVRAGISGSAVVAEGAAANLAEASDPQ